MADDGLPTPEEIAALGPPMFTWDELMDIVDSGDLGGLKRMPALQRRYDQWTAGIRREYGTMESYLLTRRLRWTPPPPSTSSHPTFSPHTPASHYRIAQNDWPYSVPPSVTHFVVWSAVPLVSAPASDSPDFDADADADADDADERSRAERAEVELKGLWGFTGGADRPQPHRPAQPDLDAGPGGARLRQGFGGRSARGITEFVRREWPEGEWEAAWFMNPPKLQSVRGLVHFHVFARPKSEAEDGGVRASVREKGALHENGTPSVHGTAGVHENGTQ